MKFVFLTREFQRLLYDVILDKRLNSCLKLEYLIMLYLDYKVLEKVALESNAKEIYPCD